MLNVMGSTATLTNLKQLKLGTGIPLSSAMGLSNPPTALPYTGNWQSIGTGTISVPNGSVIGNSAALETGVSAGTYVWQQTFTVQNITVAAGYGNFANAALSAVVDAVSSKGTAIPNSSISFNVPYTSTGHWVTDFPGIYDITYSYVDPYTGQTVSAVVQVTVLGQPTLNVQNITVVAGYGNFANAAYSAVISAINSVGAAVPNSAITFNVPYTSTGHWVTDYPGTYAITYSYTDPYTNRLVGAVVEVTVTG
jgi:hypothetical protein